MAARSNDLRQLLTDGEVDKISSKSLDILCEHFQDWSASETMKSREVYIAYYQTPNERFDSTAGTSTPSRWDPERKAVLFAPARQNGAKAARQLILKRRLESAHVGSLQQIYLSQVKYCQESIRKTFQDGRQVATMCRELQTGQKTIKDIPPITVVVDGDYVFSADNRRLWAFKNCGIPHDTRIDVKVGRRSHSFREKYTTPTTGLSIRKRSEKNEFNGRSCRQRCRNSSVFRSSAPPVLCRNIEVQ